MADTRKISMGKNSRKSSVSDTFDDSHESYLTSLTKGIRKMSFNPLSSRESFKNRESFKRKVSDANKEVLEVKVRGEPEDWETQKFQMPYAKDVISVHEIPHEWAVAIDVSGFEPDEIQVSIIRGSIVIDGYHESRRDDLGSIAREIRRIIRMPPNIQQPTLSVYLHPTGLLTIKAGKKDEQNY